MLTRNKEQEKLMIFFYEYLFYAHMNELRDVKKLLEEVFEISYDEISIFAKEVSVKSLIHLEEILKLISDHLDSWKLERLNLVTQAILILAIGEYNYLDESSKPVIINVAIELAKKYLVDDEYKFVNGILDKVL